MKKPTSKKPVSHDNASKRAFSFNLVTYLDRDTIDEYVKRDNVSNFAYITHDMDTYDADILDTDGNIIHHKGDKKEPHTHVVVTFRNARTWQAVCKDFADFDQNTRVEPVKDLEGSLRYLTHEGEKDKYRYDVARVTSTYGYFRGAHSSADADNKALQLIQDIESCLSPIELVRRYGREYVIYRKQYHATCNVCYGRPEDAEERAKNNYIADLQDKIGELERELSQMQFTLKMREKSILDMRRKSMIITSRGNVQTFTQLTENTQNPFED